MDPNPEDDFVEPANLRFLRVLVTVLTGVMIAGVVVVVALLVIRLRDESVTLPNQITLPGGETATAFTQGTDWYAVVTADDQILIFDRLSGELRQRIQIDR